MIDRLWQWMAMRWRLIVGGALLAALLLIHATSLRHKELTTDEPLHYQYGYRVLNGSPQRAGAINSSTMPFSSLQAMTSENLAVLARTSGVSIDASWSGPIKRGRYATIALSLLLALYVLKWSYELYGRNGALLSLSLYVFDPNLLAHGQLTTADLPAALMTTIALYHFWHFLELRGKRRALFSAMTLGLSQLAKYSCVYLYPIFLVLAPIYRRCAPPAEVAKPVRSHSLTWNLRCWFITVFFAAVSIVTINVGFDFNGIGTPLSGYTFEDPLFKKLQAMPIVRSLPLLLPVPYLQGLDLVKFEERMGQAWGNIYMAGHLRVNRHDGTLRGFPGYYFYAAFFKVPIATQIIFLIALFSYFSTRNQPAARALRRDEVFLLVPILFYWVYFNFFFNAQIGIRHVLPVVSLATIFCGRFLAPPDSKLRRYTAVILAVWVAASTLSYYPHFISYFNEFVPDRKLAYRHLADSNLDWHAEIPGYLSDYIRRHPGTILDPRKPQAGRIVVPVNALVGVNRNPEEYRWLREHFLPVDHVAYSFLVFDVPKEMLPQGGIETKSPKN